MTVVDHLIKEFVDEDEVLSDGVLSEDSAEVFDYLCGELGSACGNS